MFTNPRNCLLRRKRWREKSSPMRLWRYSTPWKPSSAEWKRRRKKACSWKRRFLGFRARAKTCAREPKRFWKRGRPTLRASKERGGTLGANHTMAEKLQPGKMNGSLSAEGLRFGIVVSRFNSFITDRLLASAVDALERAGAASKDVDEVHVPGALELPLTAKRLAATGKYDALIAIGCVLRGETAHYDYVCSETARGLQLAQMDTGLPIIFCVLTCDTLEQAIDRAGLKGGNKGLEAGLAAVEMAQLSRKLRATDERGAPAGRLRRK